MNPLVSVVIPTYNRRRLVVEAVESVLAQTYRPLEIIVVDDGSSDGTVAELQRYGSAVRCVTQSNQGAAAARNRGIRTATGELVAFLDSDDLWAPTKIEKQVALTQGRDRFDGVYCGVQRVDVQTGEVRVAACDPRVHGDIRRQLLQRNRLTTSSLLIRRACFDRVGLFDERLTGSEDRDMWIRLSRHYRFAGVREPLVTYRVHAENLSHRLHIMHDCQMDVVRRALRDDPHGGASHTFRRRCLAHVHFDTGGEYLLARDFRRALGHLCHAIALWPFEQRYYRLLMRALLRRPVRGGGRRARRQRARAAAGTPAGHRGAAWTGMTGEEA